MADSDLVRRLVTLLAADLPSQGIHRELMSAGYPEAESSHRDTRCADTVVMPRHVGKSGAAEQADKLGEAIYSCSFRSHGRCRSAGPMPRALLDRRQVADISPGSDCHWLR
jgi:hypothetical protein